MWQNIIQVQAKPPQMILRKTSNPCRHFDDFRGFSSYLSLLRCARFASSSPLLRLPLEVRRYLERQWQVKSASVKSFSVALINKKSFFFCLCDTKPFKSYCSLSLSLFSSQVNWLRSEERRIRRVKRAGKRQIKEKAQSQKKSADRFARLFARLSNILCGYNDFKEPAAEKVTVGFSKVKNVCFFS